MLKEFKEFAMRGNVVDMAVGIIIGAAFGAIVTSFVGDVMMPLIGLASGGTDFSNQYVLLKEGTPTGPYPSVAAAKEAGAVIFAYGLLINTIVNFLIVAWIIFLLIKGINRAMEKPADAEAGPSEIELLAEIRDELKKRSAP